MLSNLNARIYQGKYVLNVRDILAHIENHVYAEKTFVARDENTKHVPSTCNMGLNEFKIFTDLSFHTK